MTIYMFSQRIPLDSSNVLLEAILRAALQAQSVAYMQAVERGDIKDMMRIMGNIEYFHEQLDEVMVPRAGVEPALLSETDFESAASTNSANGATKLDYTGLVQKVKALGDDPEWEDAVLTETLKVYADDPMMVKSEPTLPHSTHFKTTLEERMADLLRYVELPNGWKIRVGYYSPVTAGVLFLQVQDPNGVCNVTGKPDPWNGRKWPLSQHMTDGEIINTIWKAVMTASEHELREGFKFKGVTIFDPHYDPHALVDFMKSKGSRKWRDDGMTVVA